MVDEAAQPHQELHTRMLVALDVRSTWRKLLIATMVPFMLSLVFVGATAMSISAKPSSSQVSILWFSVAVFAAATLAFVGVAVMTLVVTLRYFRARDEYYAAALLDSVKKR